ncbi:MAG TPA: TonB family protein [Pyrinomonadaceae bacterium]|nr:TonB family protein [Pyrinomonadaceae bacterium]
MPSNFAHDPSNVLSKAACALALALALTLAARAQEASAPLEDSAWAVTDSTGSTFVFEFKGGGVFRATSWAGAVSAGRWSRDADKVLVRLDANAGEYRGAVKGALIEGEAKGAGFGALKWEARREEAQPVRSAAAFPQYPPIAAAARAEGVVAVEVKVDAAGHVSTAAAWSGSPLLQQAAVAAAKRWEFNPDANAEARAVRLFFTFKMVPYDCRKRPRVDAPANEFLTGYQVRVHRLTGCIDYAVGR